MQLSSDIYRHNDNVKMLGLQKVVYLLYVKHSVISLSMSSIFHCITLLLPRLFNDAHIFIPTCAYQQWLQALDKVQSDDFQYACYLNCCLHIAKLLYSLTVLNYLDTEDLISSKTSLKYKQYIPTIISKQYMVIQSKGVKIQLDI